MLGLGVVSIFSKFWLMTGRGDLKTLAPLLYSLFETWETGYSESHAKEFTREQLLRFHTEYPNDQVGMFLKAYSVVGCSYGATRCEPRILEFGYDGCKPDSIVSFIESATIATRLEERKSDQQILLL